MQDVKDWPVPPKRESYGQRRALTGRAPRLGAGPPAWSAQEYLAREAKGGMLLIGGCITKTAKDALSSSAIASVEEQGLVWLQPFSYNLQDLTHISTVANVAFPKHRHLGLSSRPTGALP